MHTDVFMQRVYFLSCVGHLLLQSIISFLNDDRDVAHLIYSFLCKAYSCFYLPAGQSSAVTHISVCCKTTICSPFNTNK